MELFRNPELGRDFLDALTKEYMTKKPLPHVTELIYCLTRSYYDRQTDALPPTEKELLTFCVGFGLERLMLKNQNLMKAGIVDEIHYTPDFLAFSDLPGELKTTRTSVKTLLTRGISETWKRQILAYMHCEDIVEYDLVVLNIIAPELLPFRCMADQEEILDNWVKLTERRDIYMACLKANTIPPPYMFCEKWECNNCRYTLRCQTQALADGISLDGVNAPEEDEVG